MSIHQEVVFPTSPENLYDLLTDGERFAAARSGVRLSRCSPQAPPFVDLHLVDQQL